MSGPLVRAAGGIPVRRRETVAEVLVIHREVYDDWTFPKGKVEPGETDEACALREVEEETGLRCRLGPELPSTDYHDHRGRPKHVRYWQLAVEGGELVPRQGEVDDAQWLPLDEARARLSYEHDHRVLDALPDRA